MALVTVGLPIFTGDPEEDVERHVERFAGYLAGIGVNPADRAGNPRGEDRAIGLFRASLSGEAAIWFDEQFLGKHWMLDNLFNNHGQANWGAVLAQTMVQLTGTNSIRNPSEAHTFATVLANANVTLTQALPQSSEP